MRKEYDLSKMKSRPNPHIGRLKQQVTIRLRRDTVRYFKELAKETGMKYQHLIDLYLADCVESGRRPTMSWEPDSIAQERCISTVLERRSMAHVGKRHAHRCARRQPAADGGIG